MAFFFVTSTITDLLKNSNLMRVLMTVHFYDLGERILERILSSAFHLLRMKIRIDFLPHVFLPLRFSISEKRYFWQLVLGFVKKSRNTVNFRETISIVTILPVFNSLWTGFPYIAQKNVKNSISLKGNETPSL
jgi:hypothetical protein